MTTDTIDPVTMLVTIGLTWAVRRCASGQAERVLLRITPLLAVLLAVGWRAGAAVVGSEALTWALAQDAAQAGVNAVFAHAAFRSLVKELPQGQEEQHDVAEG